MNKKLTVSKVNDKLEMDFSGLKNLFQSVERNAIDQCPWSAEFPYKPTVDFAVLHNEDAIILNYQVEEQFVKGQFIRPNENVWEDSCVEFFTSLDNKETYFNFEFNVLGTGLIGYGSSVKSERNRLSAEQIETVNTFTQVNNIAGRKKWEIFLVIPKALLGESEFSGKSYHANFYKCGDALPEPHFIAWNAIDNPKPNFHLPQFFGELVFE